MKLILTAHLIAFILLTLPAALLNEFVLHLPSTLGVALGGVAQLGGVLLVGKFLIDKGWY